MEFSGYERKHAVRYELLEGDSEATEWPVYANGAQIGTVVEGKRGYQARRGGLEDGGPPAGIPHLGPDRPYRDDAAQDIVRWFEAPLEGLAERGE